MHLEYISVHSLQQFYRLILIAFPLHKSQKRTVINLCRKLFNLRITVTYVFPIFFF